MEQFNITLAETIEVTVKPRRMQKVLHYDIYIEDKIHCTIYPDNSFDHEPPLVWRSNDNIDPYLTGVIGKMIDSYLFDQR